MCRMIAAVTTAPATLAELIAPERDAFTQLAGTHKDGWGIAASHGPHDAPEISVTKSTAQALGDPEWEHALDAAHGTQFIAHIRRASAGSALNTQNTHPFLEHTNDGDLALSHHGQFPVPPRIRSELHTRISELGGRTPHGTTDSELFFGLITGHAASAGTTARSSLRQWARALERAAAHITALTREVTGEDPESLNALLMTPRGIVAYEQWDEKLRGKYKALDTYELRYIYDNTGPAPRVLIASQGWDRSHYCPLKQRHALTVDASTLTTEVIPPR